MHTHCSLETVYSNSSMGINSELWNCPTNFISMDHENQVGELNNMCLKKERKKRGPCFVAPKQIYKFFSPYFIITLQAAGLLFGSDCTRTLVLVSSIELQHTKGAEMNGNGSRERFVWFVLSIGLKWLQSIWNVGVAVWLACFVCSLCACNVIDLQSNATPELNGTSWQIQ